MNTQINTQKKNIVIFFDCHGGEIFKYLVNNEEIKIKYDVKYISLNDYIVSTGKYINDNKLSYIDEQIMKNADIFILQTIEKDRGFLNNDEVIKICKKECKIIKIPHYRNSIYNYKILEGFVDKYELIKNWKLPHKIKDLDNIDETIAIIKEEIEIMNNNHYDRIEMEKAFKFKYNEFMKIDNLSDIKMFDFFYNNYKKIRLFNGRSYPTDIFFYELTNKILQYINIKPNNNFIDYYFAENTSEPIPEYWYKYCNFEFNNIYYTYGHIEITEYEWYYILLLSSNVNILNKNENLNYIKKIRKY